MALLEGIKVVDFSKWLPGQYCGMLLGDYGADVIKIEDLQGDATRRFWPEKTKGMSYWHLMLNRNKRGVALNLKKDGGRDLLLKLLQEYGCEVSKRGKSYRLKLSGWEKAARMDSLGEGYGLEDLRAVLLGKKEHTPRKKTVTQAEPPKVNLLVDIQAKLQAGKGAGYARWAKVFNLKQMAQTMNYLSENNLLEYAVLEEKAAAATAHHNELSAQIKAAEKRMAEIAVLRTHIVNYAKTREVYVAYRKAGYSKKFREEHEEEILLHQAAKNAFDEMGVKKLPKVKELQTEYAKLLEEKKKTYAEYRRSREEMRELLTAKANVDRVLKMEVEQDVEKEKDHGQR